MRDGHRRRQPGAELRPAVVALDLDPHRHALDHAGELAGDDVPRHQRELGPGRLVDPDDPPLERLGEGVELDADRIARLDAGQAILLQVGLDVEQLGLYMLSRGEPAGTKSPRWRYRLTTTPGNGARTLVYARSFSAASSARRACSTDCSLTLTSNSISWIWSLPISARSMPLAAFCSAFCAASSALPGDVDLGPGGQGLGQPGRGQVDLGQRQSRETASPAAAAAAGWPPAARAG